MQQVLLLLSLLLTSCVSVSEMHLAPLETTAPPLTKKIQIYHRWQIVSPSLSEDQSDTIAGTYREHFERAMERNGCCESADTRDEGDIILRARSPKEIKVGVYLWALLTGLTLYTIPSWATENLEIQATVQIGKRKYERSWRDSVTLYQWLPLIFAMPFMDTPGTASDNMIDRVFDHIVADLQKDVGGP